MKDWYERNVYRFRTMMLHTLWIGRTRTATWRSGLRGVLVVSSAARIEDTLATTDGPDGNCGDCSDIRSDDMSLVERERFPVSSWLATAAATREWYYSSTTEGQTTNELWQANAEDMVGQ